jgi:hypothetical protein
MTKAAAEGEAELAGATVRRRRARGSALMVSASCRTRRISSRALSAFNAPQPRALAHGSGSDPSR